MYVSQKYDSFQGSYVIDLSSSLFSNFCVIVCFKCQKFYKTGFLIKGTQSLSLKSVIVEELSIFVQRLLCSKCFSCYSKLVSAQKTLWKNMNFHVFRFFMFNHQAHPS